LIGNGTIFGKAVFNPEFQPALIMILPPGGFITIGILMAFLHYFQNKAKEK